VRRKGERRREREAAQIFSPGIDLGFHSDSPTRRQGVKDMRDADVVIKLLA
jgi:hypothetical protein